MANIPIYPGSSSFFPGNTPFGFYDNDYQFQTDADRVVKFCTQRLGYPVMNVELQDINFYTAFEEAITKYGNELYAYQLRDNILNVTGAPTSSALNHALITPTMANIVKLSQQYATEAGIGGNVDYYSGSVVTTASMQDYNLKQWALDNNITGGIEIKRIFYQPVPAVSQMYSLNLFSGLGGVPAIGGVGFSTGTPGYLMYPTSLLMQTQQAVEMQNQVALSNYSFELINNKLRIFPIPPDDGNQIWFQYLKVDERINNAITQSPYSVTNVSNANYGNPNYTQINSIGRQWIFEYTLAICKEMLGYVRGKYQQVPIPGKEISLNQSDLITSATADKASLIERLRAYFDETSRQAQLARKSAEGTSTLEELGRSPMQIYLG